MSQFFDTFLKDLQATPYVHPDALPEQPDILDSYRTKVNMTGDVIAVGNSNNLVSALAPSGVVAGNYTRIRVNAKGQVVEGLADNLIDYSSVMWDNITQKPTTISGYGIRDSYTKGEVDIKIDDALSAVLQPFIIRTFRFEMSKVWRVKHNMASVNFVETLTNASGARIYANINIVDSTEFLIEFTSPEAGTVNVVFCMNS